jgi:hypothetical protein
MNKLSAIVSGMFLAMSANAAESNYNDMHKQINIMSNIIKSAVSDQSDGKRSKINNIQSTYLRGQGIVFTISSASSLHQWGNYNFNFVMPEVPVAPVASVNSDAFDALDIDISESISDAFAVAGSGYERAIEFYQSERESSRELRDQQRDLAHEIRDVEREKRDLNFQLQRANDERKSELKAELETLSKEAERLALSRQELTKQNNKIQAQQKAKQSERAKERSHYYKELTAALADTLCLYGNGLRALPKDENVSIILKSAGEKSGDRYKDNIIVFVKKDISACSSDQIDVASLLNKSDRYQF